MSKIMNDNFQINVGNPIDSKYLALTNQPYASVSAVNARIVESQRYVGLTVNINNVEYWYADGVTDVDLVIKDSGIASTGITAAANGLTKSGNAVILGGSLTGATAIDVNGNSLAFTTNPIQYTGDYSSQYVARSIPDADYVTGLTSQSVTSATNGITKTGQGIKLGGTTPLSEATSICGAGFALSLGTGGNRVGAFQVNAGSAAILTTGTTEICPTGALTLDGSSILVKSAAAYDTNYTPFTARQIPDAAWVTGQTGAIQANNGLTRAGAIISLGGALTGDTTITAARTHSICLGAASTQELNDFKVLATGTTEIGVVDYVGGNDTAVCISPTKFEAIQGYSSKAGIIRALNGEIELRATSGASVTTLDMTRSTIIVESTYPTFAGAEYAADYSTNYSNRSLVDKEYVTGLTSGAILTANNGLTKVGTGVVLGGALTGDTCVSLSGAQCLRLGTGTNYIRTSTGGTVIGNVSSGSVCEFVTNGGTSTVTHALDGSDTSYRVAAVTTTCSTTMCQTPNTITFYGCPATFAGIQYSAAYRSNFTDLSLVDKCYVDNAAGAIQASNGLTRVDNNITLGGALTGNTSLTGAYTLNICGGAKISTTCGYQISGTTILRAPNPTIGSIFIGASAGNIASVAINNIAIGCQALGLNTSATNQIAIGFQALYSGASAGYNTALGYQAQYKNGYGIHNFAVGCKALYNSLNQNNNIAIGPEALCLTSTGQGNNVALGARTLLKSVTGSRNIAIGYQAGCGETGSDKLYISNDGSANPLIYGDFAARCLQVGGVLKISGATCMITTPATGALTDVVLVRNSSAGEIRCVPISSITGATAISANNGLTKAGNVISLGGSLTGDTTINGGNHDNCFIIASPFQANDVHFFTFHDTPAQTGHTCGRLYYQDNTLNLDREFTGVTLQIGEETVIKVENTTGGPLSNGQAVYINGATFGFPTIALSQANTEANAADTIGLLTMDVENNNEAYVTVRGIVRGVNTGSFTAGDTLWLSPTVAGAWVNVSPSYPNQVVKIGVVTYVDSSDGEIFVSVEYHPNHISTSDFNSYSASTLTNINSRLLKTTFNSYTGTTKTTLDTITPLANAAITGVTNGLTKVGSHSAKLGGALSENTIIQSDGGNRSLSLSKLSCIYLVSSGASGNILASAQGNGTVTLKSTSCSGAEGSNFTCSVGIQLDYDASTKMLVTDNSVNPRGLQYADDYTATYCDRSLVDKYYVDSIATGLNVHAAVVAATTGNTVLSGNTGSVDGIAVSAITATNNRILVKDQTNGALNGIYSASTGTWGRTADYDFTPAGEISNGDLVPVLSGTTNANSQWINVSVNPIDSGDTITFSIFSQQQGIVGGNGISVDTVGSNREVSVLLSPSNSGLCFDSTALELDYTTFTCGLDTGTAGEVRVYACATPATGIEIPVRFATGCDALVVDKADFSYTTASNGLTKVDTNVTLGGTLTGDTNISGNGGAYSLGLLSLSALTLSFGSSNITDNITGEGLVYSANYAGTFVDNSLVSKYFVNNAITGSTLTYCDGITKTGKIIQWGGTATTDRALIRSSSNLCVKSTGIDVIADCSCIATTSALITLNTCGNTAGCAGTISIANTGAISLTSTNATLPICVTAPQAMRYAANYSSIFNVQPRSIPDAAWVTGKTSTSGIQTANNGLTKNGTNVRLGGALTGDTCIGVTSGCFCLGDSTGSYFMHKPAETCILHDNGAGPSGTIKSTVNSIGLLTTDWNTSLDGYICINNTANLLLCSNNFGTSCSTCLGMTPSAMTIGGASTFAGAQYAADYSTNFNNRSLVDKEYVDGAAGAISASNGLTRVDDNITLGGALTGDTTISGAHTLCLSSLTAFNATATNIALIGAVGVTGALNVSSNIDGNGTLDILGATALRSTLNVTGATNLTSLNASGAIDGNSTLDILGATALRSTLNVTGATNLTSLNASGAIDGNSTLDILGATALRSTLNVTGATTLTSLNTSGAIDANSTLNVAGATALQGTLAVTGATSLCSTVTLPTVAAGAISNPIMVLDAGVVKCVPASSYNVTAVNGLTATGNEVKLGGALTTNTNIITDLYGLQICSTDGVNYLLTKSGCTEINHDNSVSAYAGLTIKPNSVNLWQGDYAANTIYSELDMVSGYTCLYVCNQVSGCKSSIQMTQFGNTIVCPATYAGNYSGIFNVQPRSIPDAAWVTGQTSTAGIQTANNGLTKVGTNAVLGGALTGSTTIDNSGYTFVIGDGTTELQVDSVSEQISLTAGSNELSVDSTSMQITGMPVVYAADYSGSYVARSIPDAAWVTGQTSTSGVQSATNGLTKSGTVVVLGGTLTGNTTIQGGGALQLGNTTPLTAFNAYASGNMEFDAGSGNACLSLNGSGSVVELGNNSAYFNISGSVIDTCGTVKLSTTPATGAISDAVLVWNSSDKQIKQIAADNLGQDNNIYEMTVVTTDVTLTTGSTYVQLINNASSGLTITLPAAPINGQVFRIKDAAAAALTYGITIARNGKLIDGAANNASINTDSGALEIVYNAALGSWFVFSFVN